MRRWQRRTVQVVATLAVAGLLVWGATTIPTAMTAFGTVATALVAVGSLVVVVRLDQQLVAIETARRAEEIRPRVTAAIEVPAAGTGHGSKPRIVMRNVGATAAYAIMADVFLFADGRADQPAETLMAADERPLPILDAGGTYPIAMQPGWVFPPHRFLVALTWQDADGVADSRQILLRP